MRSFVLALVLSTAACAAEKASLALPHAAAPALSQTTPEEQGISSSAIASFVESADREVDAIQSFILVRHGHVVAEGWWAPYAADVPHTMFSLSKSFTSTAIGLAIADGKLSLNDPVLRFFPESAPAQPSDNLKALRVRDLLTMSTGQTYDAITKLGPLSDDHLTRAFLTLPVEYKPGTFFVYNTPASYMLSAIVQKVTGQTVLDFLEPRLLAPIGIASPPLDMSRDGVSLCGVGLNLRNDDLDRFGSLYLNKGMWNGSRLLPAWWGVEAATQRQMSNGSNPDNDLEQGYGFQFWRSRHDTYQGNGAFGQFCIVMPAQDAVVAMTSGTRDMQGVLNLVWDKLLPAMQPRPLPANPGARAKLEHTLAGLTLHLPQGSATSPTAALVSGKTYVFPANAPGIEAAAVEFRSADATLILKSEGHEYRIGVGAGQWQKGTTAFVGNVHPWMANRAVQPVAASGAWTAADIYTIKLALYETSLAMTLAFRFAGDRLVVLNVDYSVEFGPTKVAVLLGDAR